MHGAGHGAPRRIHPIREHEVLETEGLTERPEEEDPVRGCVLDPPVVSEDIGPLQASILDDERGAVHDREQRLHLVQLRARGFCAQYGVAREPPELLDLDEELEQPVHSITLCRP